MRYGMLIIFSVGTTREEAEEFAIALEERDEVHEAMRPHEFDPEVGYPVWYIP